MNLVAGIFTAMIFLLPPVAVYAPMGMTPLVCTAAVALLFDRRVRDELAASGAPRILWAFAPLSAWALASVAWTIQPGRAVNVWLSIVLLAAAAWVLAVGARLLGERDQKRVTAFMVGSAAMFLIILGVENFSEGFVIKFLKASKGKGVNDYMAWINPGNTILSVCAWPMIFAAGRRINLLSGVLLYGLIITVLAFGTSSAPVAAMLVSSLVFAAVSAGKRPVLIAVAASLAVGALAFPFFIQLFTSDEIGQMFSSDKGSWQHRWAIWEFVRGRIMDHPLIGWGLDSSRFIPGGRENIFGQNYAEILPLHPHNAFLQIWLELGVVGAAAMAVLTASVPFQLHRMARDWPGTACLMAGFIVYMVLGQLSFGIWQNWWIATGIVMLTLFLAAMPQKKAAE
ncbi:MAG: hypothetical protein A3G18_08790 [Rhodospirillales bacterium RIFCSPLOWO2_12_FULL_58_28]|nr:MAG: hypothetical protein A3H92_00345 [Rhodospirillales bacterium RIFCSPLOWO2_02_FULL_58_16]OHC79791.1 MAG: hypothetical protein A3G18_08790 [Rhodospirillales bacterium RIFCSPLOWO2_12_FULL_58_28]